MDRKKEDRYSAIDPNLLDYSSLIRALDNAVDEIFIVDKNIQTAYINRASEGHYGLDPKTLLGKTIEELAKTGYALPYTVTPKLVEELSKGGQRLDFLQTTQLGKKIYTSASPVFNEKGELDFIIMNVRDMGAIKNGLEHFSAQEAFVDTNKPKTFFIPANGFKNRVRLIAESEAMQEVLSLANQVGEVDSNVLLTGESGTGKSVLAHYIHDWGRRKDGPFMSINCAAIPEGLLESELFGYSGGAFTGAHKGGKAGLVELADKGTLFLDEISEMPLPLQAKLLQLIQEKQYIPVGGRGVKKVDIHIIVASNQDLPELIDQRRFRKDLYYRLNVIEIHLPELKERPEDLRIMLPHFLKKYDDRFGRSHRFQDDAFACLMAYDWPGNVRELENVMERLVVTKKNLWIKPEDLPVNIRRRNEKDAPILPKLQGKSLDEAKEVFEKEMISKAKADYGSTRKIAGALQISQSRVVRLLQKYQLDGEEG